MKVTVRDVDPRRIEVMDEAMVEVLRRRITRST